VAGVSIRRLWDPSLFLLDTTAGKIYFSPFEDASDVPACFRESPYSNPKNSTRHWKGNFSCFMTGSPKVTSPFTRSLTLPAQGVRAGQETALLSRPPKSTTIAGICFTYT